GPPLRGTAPPPPRRPGPGSRMATRPQPEAPEPDRHGDRRRSQPSRGLASEHRAGRPPAPEAPRAPPVPPVDDPGPPRDPDSLGARSRGAHGRPGSSRHQIRDVASGFGSRWRGMAVGVEELLRRGLADGNTGTGIGSRADAGLHQLPMSQRRLRRRRLDAYG